MCDIKWQPSVKNTKRPLLTLNDTSIVSNILEYSDFHESEFKMIIEYDIVWFIAGGI